MDLLLSKHDHPFILGYVKSTNNKSNKKGDNTNNGELYNRYKFLWDGNDSLDAYLPLGER